MSVYAGIDPVTGKRVYLRETIKGVDKAAYKRAEKAMNRAARTCRHPAVTNVFCVHFLREPH
ncbi:hypothetical protein [Actinophytocola sp.]|uniref:hypothetical protein n=1 Tax=Actinophytocola sp. TaxID=1872138 RepID=UPI002ED31223